MAKSSIFKGLVFFFHLHASECFNKIDVGFLSKTYIFFSRRKSAPAPEVDILTNYSIKFKHRCTYRNHLPGNSV